MLDSSPSHKSGERENHESTSRYFNVCMYTAVARTCDGESIFPAMHAGQEKFSFFERVK